MTTFVHRIWAPALAALTLALSACGGGGTPQATQAQTAAAPVLRVDGWTQPAYNTASVGSIKARALDAELSKVLNPSQQIVKFVDEELVSILGGEARAIRHAKRPPTVIMLAGLQGAGKTTLLRQLIARSLARGLQRQPAGMGRGQGTGSAAALVDELLHLTQHILTQRGVSRSVRNLGHSRHAAHGRSSHGWRLREGGQRRQTRLRHALRMEHRYPAGCCPQSRCASPRPAP